MMRKLVLPVIFMLAFVSIFAYGVSAAPGGGNATAGATSQGTGTATTTVDIEGGNVTYASVNSDQITTNWAGFYGNVSGGLVLSDASANSFYEWTISNWDGAVVYATSGAITAWGAGDLQAAAAGNMPVYVQGTATDSFSNTFTATEAFNSTSINEAAVPYVTTFQSGAAGTIKTYALWSTTDSQTIFAGLVDDNSASFRGAGYTVDYQILVPAQGTTTYNFYLELP